MKYKRIVVKLGTNLLTGGTDKLNIEIMSDISRQLAFLHDKGHEIILVSSGAVAAGRQKLSLTRDRKDIPFKQVLASVGQNQLMNIYEQLFNTHNITVAQALLTKTDLSNRAGYLNARNTLLALLELGVICIVNENDVVATDEIGGVIFGDNDNLSALVANLVDADLLVLLTDIDGLYTANPQKSSDAQLIHEVKKIDSRVQRYASRTPGSHGVGGMATKVQAAKMATSCGITMVIAGGQTENILERIVNGERVGTLFIPQTSKIESRKRWMLSGLASKGKLIVDEGAAIALTKQNKSLLPAGVVELDGRFQRGNPVDIYDIKNNYLGCGIANYNSNDINAIKGAQSQSVAGILGYEYGSEVIHRNNMVLLEE
jgi:glutamate 5-kinase